MSKKRWRWLVAGVVPAAFVLVTGAWVWHARTAQLSRPGDKISLRGGLITFRMPQGWGIQDCSTTQTDCVVLRTPHGTAYAVWISILTPVTIPSPPPGALIAVAIDPFADPDSQRFPIDGLPFARMHLPPMTAAPFYPGRTFVSGHLRNQDIANVLCLETGDAQLVRAGCETVITSIHIRG